MVTTDGPLTETVWRETGAVALVPAGVAPSFAGEVKTVAADAALGAALGARGRRLYNERFDLAHSVSALRQGRLAVSVQ